MEYIYAAVFGLVQGLTEFLPVSSSGHLVLLHRFLELPVKDEISFDVSLHLATLIAVVWFFRHDLIVLFQSWLKSLSDLKTGTSDLSWQIIIATVPAALAGYLLDDYIESVFRSPLIVAFMLVSVGTLFLLVEKKSRKDLVMSDLTPLKSFLVGCAQALALIPGTSRSGITIIAGMGLNLKREEAIRFSFLLSIPIIAGAALKELPQLIKVLGDADEAKIILVAFLFAFASSLLAIRYLLAFARKYSLNAFAYYRFALAALVVLFLV